MKLNFIDLVMNRVYTENNQKNYIHKIEIVFKKIFWNFALIDVSIELKCSLLFAVQ